MTPEKNPLDYVEELAQKLNTRMNLQTKSVFARYPLTFSLLTVFGIVAILYGFESFINTIPFLAERPLLILGIGVGILIFTGTLYKNLNQRRLK